jgi:23S rRNA pseudouridine2605 synthase
VPLARALSKLGILTRAEAVAAIRAGRVLVNGRRLRDPATRVVPEAIAVALDGAPRPHARWRTLLLHKPRGVLTTRRDPGGRPTVYDILGGAGTGLKPVGRLDLATSGLLLLTTDPDLAEWITNPAHEVPRLYAVTVRGRVEEARLAALTTGIVSRGERLCAAAVTLRKASARESHLTVELREGRNREVRRLFEGVGHEVTRLKRVALGGLVLGDLPPGAWRKVSADEVRRAFPGVSLHAFGESPGSDA